MSDISTNLLNPMVRGAYDLQKIRIQMGLRLYANFRNKLKNHAIEKGEIKKEELSEEAENLISSLKRSHKRITDGIAKNPKLPNKEGFIGDELLSDFAEYILVNQYIAIEKNERAQFRDIQKILEPIPIYDQYLRNQIGIGPASAGVLLTYFDIHKAERPSCFWAYSGLDVGPDGRGRSRRKEHLIEREYIKKDGTVGTKLSTTYNPWLQARLIGAMATAMMRAGSPWRHKYDQYKHRIITDPNRIKLPSTEWKKTIEAGADPLTLWTPARIHKAAVRYMLKMFLLDLWTKWRTIEGLSVVGSYEEWRRGYPHKTEREPFKYINPIIYQKKSIEDQI